MTELQPDPHEGTLVENEGVNAQGKADDDAAEVSQRPDRRPDAARAGGNPDAAGDDVHRAALGTEFDDEPELAGSPDEPDERAQDAGGQDSGSIA